ncbi:MAG TPA: serine hydrolase domain-containing protein [Bacilli bacterium]|nr:serine hydrolase domain-containing protein [Bacilli bacterium]
MTEESINIVLSDFIKEYIESGTYAKEEDIISVLVPVLNTMKNNKDATPKEWVEKIIRENIETINNFMENHFSPGYTIGINVGDMDVKLYGGRTRETGIKMPENALFDIASMTKLYTQILICILINQGVFTFDDKISDLDDRFVNLEDLTVREIFNFGVNLRTPGSLQDFFKGDEALNCLYGTSILSQNKDGENIRGKYCYTDIGMMVMTEVMERVTGKSYKQLLDEYILSPMNINETYLTIPPKDIDLVTGTPNAFLGLCNDPKAIAVSGYSGHAGIFASSDALIKFGKSIPSLLSEEDLKTLYTPGLIEKRGQMGNTYVPHIKGLDKTLHDVTAPLKAMAYQGSTRVQGNYGYKEKNGILIPSYGFTTLLNPCSTSIKTASKLEKEINEERKAKGKTPVRMVRSFGYEHTGEILSMDMREAIPIGDIDPITKLNQYTVIRLMFIQKIIDLETKINKNADSKVKVKKYTGQY